MRIKRGQASFGNARIQTLFACFVGNNRNK